MDNAHTIHCWLPGNGLLAFLDWTAPSRRCNGKSPTCFFHSPWRCFQSFSPGSPVSKLCALHATLPCRAPSSAFCVSADLGSSPDPLTCSALPEGCSMLCLLFRATRLFLFPSCTKLTDFTLPQKSPPGCGADSDPHFQEGLECFIA